MSEAVAQDQLRSIIERVENLDAEIADLNDGKKEIFAEARGNGFDVKVIKRVIAIRRQDSNERAEQDAVLDLYLQALGMVG